MVGLEQISIDGTILKASASNNSAVTDKELAVISEYIDEELKKGIDIDTEEGLCRKHAYYVLTTEFTENTENNNSYSSP